MPTTLFESARSQQQTNNLFKDWSQLDHCKHWKPRIPLWSWRVLFFTNNIILSNETQLLVIFFVTIPFYVKNKNANEVLQVTFSKILVQYRGTLCLIYGLLTNRACLPKYVEIRQFYLLNACISRMWTTVILYIVFYCIKQQKSLLNSLCSRGVASSTYNTIV